MTLATRISRMETVSAASERVLRLIASDEADIHRQFEDLLLTNPRDQPSWRSRWPESSRGSRIPSSLTRKRWS
jgi:hypothetical protein